MCLVCVLFVVDCCCFLLFFKISFDGPSSEKTSEQTDKRQPRFTVVKHARVTNETKYTNDTDKNNNNNNDHGNTNHEDDNDNHDNNNNNNNDHNNNDNNNNTTMTITTIATAFKA